MFLGGANVNGSGAREFNGLEAQIDDGTNVTTFQGLTRSTYPDVLYSQIIDSSTYTAGVRRVVGEHHRLRRFALLGARGRQAERVARQPQRPAVLLEQR
jgi:hypothetical protein